MAKDVIVACDFPSMERTLDFLDLFEGKRKPFVKIGMELFYAEGPDVVRKIKERGHKVFLDLKLHDIPNTVAGGMRSLAGLGVDMTNVHASGGIKMMKAGLEGLTSGGQSAADQVNSAPVLIAVTQLTSTSQEMLAEELLIDKDINDVIVKYALNAKAAGLGGVVCSPLEAGLIHEACGSDFLTVTPGIRFSDSTSDDQARITTPAKARELGSDYIVIGRPVTQAEDPVEAYMRAVSDFLG
ncbi:MAG: orotidine-5'-phosphate decarboxylase [Eubacterium sp.]|nr:orotidine-5'-phosphate decarboxylase [Eubacterium sp.]